MRRIGVLMNLGRRRSGRSGPHRGVPAGAAAIGLDRSAATCGSTRAGPRAMPSAIRRYAAELVALAPDVILAAGASTAGGHCCRRPARVPIVFAHVGDPVGAGFVDSLARPGGNVTGFHDVRIRHERRNGWSCSSRSRRA